MRLVDADSLKEIIDENEKWVLELIDDIPTACDIDKMVEQLEKETWGCTDIEEIYEKGAVTLRDAVKIVKERGV